MKYNNLEHQVRLMYFKTNLMLKIKRKLKTKYKNWRIKKRKKFKYGSKKSMKKYM